MPASLLVLFRKVVAKGELAIVRLQKQIPVKLGTKISVHEVKRRILTRLKTSARNEERTNKMIMLMFHKF